MNVNRNHPATSSSGVLPSIAELFLELKDKQESSLDVNIRSAFEVTDDAKAELSRALKTKLDKEIKVETEIDKSLLGGVFIRAGDIVIDGSVKGRLAKLAETLSVQ